ncbi:MAG TPA: phytoene/squalene synthase family protein [Cyclobacteriaceae bacterium]|nr:phytoene/squalene synthase family protein [Cyclobacteriaceae bacterium]
MKELFDSVSITCSKVTTRTYSTSFSLGIFCLEKALRDPIYSIYGFVRFADEIVDSFHDYDKDELLEKFKSDTYESIQKKISLNPILNSFQHTVNLYHIEKDLIDQFLESMKMDLSQRSHSDSSFKEYILGSAEVVGLMCLRVFCKNDDKSYHQLRPYAMKLGSAFQKVNFLRDLQADYIGLGRSYFPGIDFERFDEHCKRKIEISIQDDFDQALIGIKQLPRSSRFGVYVAFVYYLALFRKIKNTPSESIIKSRIRIRNRQKAGLLAYSFVRHQLNLI